MFLETRNAVVGGLAAEPDEDVVVLDVVAVGEFDDLFVDVEAGDFVLDEPGRRVGDLRGRERDVGPDVRVPNNAVCFV